LSSLRLLINCVKLLKTGIKSSKRFESHVLIDSLKSENTMLFDIIYTLENKLKESEDLLNKFSSDNLKSMFCSHSDISNKSDLIVDDLSASTSHASELDSIVIVTPRKFKLLRIH
jgi:hypothetical protein